MAQLAHVVTLTGGAAGSDPIVGLERFAVTGGVVLQAYTATGARLRSWDLGAGQADVTGAVDPGAAIGVARLELTLPGGGTHRLQDDQLGRIIEASAGQGGGLRVALDQARLSTLQVEAAWFDAGSSGWLYLEDPSGGGLVRYTVSDAALGGSGTLSLSAAASYDTGALDDLVHLSVGGTDYLIAVGAGTNGAVTVWQVGAGGALTQTGAVPDGQGVGDPSAAVGVAVAGVTYLAVAGQGSGSISVYQLTAMGGLTRTDHVLDDTAQTRFAGITQLETISAGGRSYLVAAGNDQGISLLEMLPGGRLLHLASFADTAATALDSVSALALHAEGDVVQIFATSASDGRVSQFRYDPGDLGVTEIGSSSSERLTGGDDADILAGGGGNDTLSGGAGDDVLMDGAGEDQMTGGAGADIFVISADGVRDTIIDFDVTQDRIDLSAYEMLYDVSQLDIQTTSYGARLTWRGEELRVFDPNRDPLSAADFSNATLFNLNRPPIGSFTARAMLEGDNAANRLEGPAPNLEISGLDGDDVLISQGGDNLLVGGGGVDLADYGGVTLVVSVDLQAGLAVIGSEGWQDQLIEIENLRGGTLGDVLAGDVGDNTLWGEEGADSLLGGFGSDELVGGTGADTLRGEDGADTLFGNTSTDLLYGQGGDDELRGESGNDELRGSSGADSLLGGAGDDELHGGTGVDTLRGDSGNDTLYGNQGADPLYGDDGNDTLRGGTGDDSLAGGAGNDTIYGNQGVDTLVGGAGDDFLRGGTRADTFVYASGSDQIDDFDAGEDRLQLDAALWSGSLSAAEVLDQFGSQVGGDYVLDFGGGDTLTFNGGISESALEAVLTFI